MGRARRASPGTTWRPPSTEQDNDVNPPYTYTWAKKTTCASTGGNGKYARSTARYCACCCSASLSGLARARASSSRRTGGDDDDDDSSPTTPDTIVVADFADGKPWEQTNDPVMGGKSHGHVYRVRRRRRDPGRFLCDRGPNANSTVVHEAPYRRTSDVRRPRAFVSRASSRPRKRAPFPDVSVQRLCDFVQALDGHPMGDYAGYRLGFGTQRAPEDPEPGRWSSGFHAPFQAGMVLTDVEIPFTAFSDDWDAATGEIIVSCADDPECVPRIASPRSPEIQRLGRGASKVAFIWRSTRSRRSTAPVATPRRRGRTPRRRRLHQTSPRTAASPTTTKPTRHRCADADCLLLFPIRPTRPAGHVGLFAGWEERVAASVIGTRHANGRDRRDRWHGRPAPVAPRDRRHRVVRRRLGVYKRFRSRKLAPAVEALMSAVARLLVAHEGAPDRPHARQRIGVHADLPGGEARGDGARALQVGL